MKIINSAAVVLMFLLANISVVQGTVRGADLSEDRNLRRGGKMMMMRAGDGEKRGDGKMKGCKKKCKGDSDRKGCIQRCRDERDQGGDDRQLRRKMMGARDGQKKRGEGKKKGDGKMKGCKKECKGESDRKGCVQRCRDERDQGGDDRQLQRGGRGRGACFDECGDIVNIGEKKECFKSCREEKRGDRPGRGRGCEQCQDKDGDEKKECYQECKAEKIACYKLCKESTKDMEDGSPEKKACFEGCRSE